MATQIPRELYPLSAQNGQPIPLDVIKPTAFRFISVNDSTFSNVAFTVENELISLYADVDIILSFTGASFTAPLVAGTSYEDTLFIPAYVLVTVEAVVGEGKAISRDGSGTLFIQSVERWSAIASPRDARIR